MIRAFGLLLAVGIAGSASRRSHPGGHPRYPRVQVADGPKGGRLQPRLSRSLHGEIGSLPAASAIPLIFASLVIFFGGLAVEDKLTLQTDPIEWSIRVADDQGHQEARQRGALVERDGVFGAGTRMSSPISSSRSRTRSLGHAGQVRTLEGAPLRLILTGRASRRPSEFLDVPGASDIARREQT